MKVRSPAKSREIKSTWALGRWKPQGLQLNQKAVSKKKKMKKWSGGGERCEQQGPARVGKGRRPGSDQGKKVKSDVKKKGSKRDGRESKYYFEG